MLLWQFHTYNHHLEQRDAAAPKHEGPYIFNAQTMAPPPPPKPDVADVRQVGFNAEEGKPSPGQFICHVTLQNIGKVKATHVQIMVSPYHGAWVGAPNGTDEDAHVVNSSDAAYTVSQWLSFPDLAPGEKVTRDITFYNQYGLRPGNDERPQIQFESEKPQSATPAPTR